MMLRASLLAALLLCACGDDTLRDRDAAGDDDDGDGGPDPVDADPSAPDAAPPDGATGVACGDTACDDGQECCVDQAAATCVAVDSCQGALIGCDGAEDCPEDGQVCCFDLGGGPGSGGSACAAAQGCQAVSCQVTEDCPGMNQECCEVGGFRYCAAQCPAP